MRDRLSVPPERASITAEWLGEALSSTFPSDRLENITLTRIGEGFGFSGSIYRAGLEWSAREGRGRAGAPPVSVVVKLWPTSAGSNEVRALDLLRSARVRSVPQALAGSIDERTGRGVLVLRDVADAVQGDCLQGLDAIASRRLAARLGAVHGAFHASPRLEEESWLPIRTHSGRDATWFVPRRSRFLERFGDRIDGTLTRLADAAESIQARADEMLHPATETLIHGDFHLDNVIFDSRDGEPVILDWNSAARGPGALDLVDLVVHISPVAARESVIDAYHRALESGGVTLTRSALDRELDAAFLRSIVTWTLGLARWEPDVPRARAITPVVLERLSGAMSWWSARSPELFDEWIHA